jgi:hypothetical protein
MQNHAHWQIKLENSHILDAKSLLKTEVEKDLGVIISSNLKSDLHVNNAVLSFNYLNVKSSSLLFTSLIRPHLEYAP